MLKPLGKRIIIQPVEAPVGKLIIPNHKPTQFTVIAIGDDVAKVKVGDIIYVEKHQGIEIEHEAVKYIVVEESSILAKI